MTHEVDSNAPRIIQDLATVLWLMAPTAPDAATTLADILGRPEWHARALCRGIGTKEFIEKPTEAARALCAGCPVHRNCLGFALAHEHVVGIWAGTDEKERREMRKKNRVA